MELGPQSPSDNNFTAKCRLHQSWYRAHILNEPWGNGPTKNSKKAYGNMLINGETSGSNFISAAAYDFAKDKVNQKKFNKYMTIDDFRLFNNMLSSMPMCFNLFSDLRVLLSKNEIEASRIIRLLFSEIKWIETVKNIDIEFIPTPIEDYTNDKSAFDAMIIVRTADDKNGLISIETKYTDLLGANTAADSRKKNEIVNNSGVFTPALMNELSEKGYKQIHRNFLLTYAFAKNNEFDRFTNVIISPEEDSLSLSEMNELKTGMTKYQDSILKISLQDFVRRGLSCKNDEIELLMNKFKERYLDYRQ